MTVKTSLQGLGWTEASFEQLKKACELDVKNGEAAFNLAMVSLALPEPKVKFAKLYFHHLNARNYGLGFKTTMVENTSSIIDAWDVVVAYQAKINSLACLCQKS